MSNKPVNKELFADYSIGDFDKYNCLKVSKGVYFLLIFVLRGYLVWLMSVTNMQDRASIIGIIYPDPKLFYLSLASGALGLFVLLIISLRRPNAPQWVKTCWCNSRSILMLSLFFDLLISFVGFINWQLLSVSWLVTQSIITGLFVVYLYKNQRFKINIQEFPEEIEAQ